MNIIKNNTMKELNGITQAEQNFRELHQELIDLNHWALADKFAICFYKNASDRFEAGLDAATNIHTKNQ